MMVLPLKDNSAEIYDMIHFSMLIVFVEMQMSHLDLSGPKRIIL